MSRTSRSRPGAAPAPAPSKPARQPDARAARPTPERRHETHAEVPDGIGFHARHLRTFGVVAALVPMAVTGLGSVLVLWGSQSTLRGVIGFVLAVVSCPTLALFGFPISTGGTMWMLAIASSAGVWMALGFVAARRCATRAVAGWAEWRRELLRLAVGVWIGAFVGFAVAGVLLTVDF